MHLEFAKTFEGFLRGPSPRQGDHVAQEWGHLRHCPKASHWRGPTFMVVSHFMHSRILSSLISCSFPCSSRSMGQWKGTEVLPRKCSFSKSSKDNLLPNSSIHFVICRRKVLCAQLYLCHWAEVDLNSGSGKVTPLCVTPFPRQTYNGVVMRVTGYEFIYALTYVLSFFM